MGSSCAESARTFAKSEALSCTRFSAPFALPFSSGSAVALSGLRHAATTRLGGAATSCFARSRSTPQFALRGGDG